MNPTNRNRQRGFHILYVIGYTSVTFILMFSLLSLVLSGLGSAHQDVTRSQCLYAADGAIQTALARVAQGAQLPITMESAGSSVGSVSQSIVVSLPKILGVRVDGKVAHKETDSITVEVTARPDPSKRGFTGSKVSTLWRKNGDGKYLLISRSESVLGTAQPE